MDTTFFDRVKEQAALGLNLTRIATNLNTSRARVSRAVASAGIPVLRGECPVEGTLRYREEIKNIPPAERVPYLLDLLDFFLEPDHDFNVLFDLTPNQARLVQALAKRKGHIVTKGSILASMYFDVPDDDWPDPKIVDVFVCKIRSHKDLPFTIHTEWGRGYRLTTEAGYRFPWEVA